MKKLTHGMLLDAKKVMDNALPDLEGLQELVPYACRAELQKLLDLFQDALCTADVSADYEEKRAR